MLKKCDDIITCAGSGHHLRPDRIRIIKEMPGSVASGTLCIIAEKYSMGCVCLFVSVEIVNNGLNIARHFDVSVQVRITFQFTACSRL